jgi:hypothetical protein
MHSDRYKESAVNFVETGEAAPTDAKTPVVGETVFHDRREGVVMAVTHGRLTSDVRSSLTFDFVLGIVLHFLTFHAQIETILPADPLPPTTDAALIQYKPGYEQDVVDLFKFSRVNNIWMSGEGAPPPSAPDARSIPGNAQQSPPKALRRFSPVPPAPDVTAPMFGEDGNVMFE